MNGPTPACLTTGLNLVHVDAVNARRDELVSIAQNEPVVRVDPSMIRDNHRKYIVVFALFATIVLCTIIALPRPDSAFERLTPTALLLNGLPVAYFFLAFLLIVRRSLSATMLTVFVCVAITLGNNFKSSIISQPVVASDFILFGQVLENPVLFEKYLREQWMVIPLFLVYWHYRCGRFGSNDPS